VPLPKAFSILFKDTVMVAQCVVCNGTDCVCAITIKVVTCNDATQVVTQLQRIRLLFPWVLSSKSTGHKFLVLFCI